MITGNKDFYSLLVYYLPLVLTKVLARFDDADDNDDEAVSWDEYKAEEYDFGEDEIDPRYYQIIKKCTINTMKTITV